MNKLKKFKFILVGLCVITASWLAPSLIRYNPSMIFLFTLTVVVLVLEKFFAINFKYMRSEDSSEDNSNKVLLNELSQGNPLVSLFNAYGVFVLYVNLLGLIPDEVWYIRGASLLFFVVLLGLNKLIKEVQCKISQNIS